MSFYILEGVRQSLASNLDAKIDELFPVANNAEQITVAERVYPDNPDTTERMRSSVDTPTGALPIVTFAMLEGDPDSLNRVNGRIAIKVLSRTDNKKTIWAIHAAVQEVLKAQTIQGVMSAQNFPEKISLINMSTERDVTYDDENKMYFLYSEYTIKSVKIVRR